MIAADARAVISKAQSIYDSRLRQTLEASDRGRFVAIEPESEDYFLGDTFDEAVNAALDRYADRLTHTIRIGFPAALHLVGCVQISR